ncbi:F-box only protein 42-like isoform X2 [Brienomyrus brachyistius]|nr:F-box only protein 42-like isoform X2 [Brienomyrus brachyistius]XP_048840047.1 F-box only protein 42-like isoform X2 [Brienomyrus brachyistius]XP_048840048.1 F-box only protein 42-like isoform X2 [Brienomyrus brachyistius]XP_048840049.1 F-box only protein 42-like isoform X2 [Brienomyrus brachyistius]
MSRVSDSEDEGLVAMDTEEVGVELGRVTAEKRETKPNNRKKEGVCERTMGQLPEEVLEYILSFLSPYQEHKTAALVCKQWYRLIKGVAHQCYHGFLRAVQEGNIQWESRTYPYPGTPITQRFSHSACYYDLNQSMYVFGGCTQSSCNAAFNDLWRLDLNSKEWIRPLASGSYPSPKAGATLVVFRDILVLFGGWTRPSPYPLHQPERFFDEIHTYSPSKNWWNCIVTTHGPPPMAGHSTSVIGSRMVVFGGSLGARQMSNDVWVLDLEHWSWSKPSISGPTPHPRGGQSQIVIDDKTLLILGGCGGPNALLKDAWLLHMGAPPWSWQQLRVENEEFGAPELWCHPACRVGQCVVVFSQAPSGRAPLSPSLNSRPSPISATPPALIPEPPSLRSQSPVRGGATGVVLGAPEEAPCVNGRWGTLRPRPSPRPGAREGSPSSSQQQSPSQGPDSPPLPPLPPLLNGSSPSPRTSPAQATSPPSRPHAPGASEQGWDSPTSFITASPSAVDHASSNGLCTPPGSPQTPTGAVSPGALRRGLEAVKALSASLSSSSSSSSSSSTSQSHVGGGGAGGGTSGPSSSSSSPPNLGQAAGVDGHSIPPIARRLGHHPPQSLNVGKPLYQSLNCKPMQMYVLDVSRAKESCIVSWKVFGSGAGSAGPVGAVVGPPETSLHTVVQGRGELIIFGGLMDKKQNVKYYPKTNALYFVRAKR